MTPPNEPHPNDSVPPPQGASEGKAPPAEQSVLPLRSESLRDIDWCAVAPWLSLLRAPQVAAGLPWGIAAAATLVIGPRRDGAVSEAPLFSPLSAAMARFNALSDSVVGHGVAVGLLRAAVWSVVGLVAARAAADAWTLGPRRTTRDSFRALPRRVAGLAGAAALVAAPALVALALLLFAGWVARAGLLAPIVAVAWPLVMAAAGLLAVLGFAAVVGWPLGVAALGVDDCDPFDAMSRQFAYTLQRPARLAFYVAVAALAGLAAGSLLELVLAGTLWAAEQLVACGAGGPLTGRAAAIADWWGRRLDELVAGYYPAYVFTAAVPLYLLLRRDIDGQALDERWSESRDSERWSESRDPERRSD